MNIHHKNHKFINLIIQLKLIFFLIKYLTSKNIYLYPFYKTILIYLINYFQKKILNEIVINRNEYLTITTIFKKINNFSLKSRYRFPPLFSTPRLTVANVPIVYLNGMLYRVTSESLNHLAFGYFSFLENFEYPIINQFVEEDRIHLCQNICQQQNIK